MINEMPVKEEKNLIEYDENKLRSDMKNIKKHLKRINSILYGDPTASVSGLKTFILSLKNNLKIKKGILNLEKDEREDNLMAYNNIFNAFPKLKENSLLKLMKNFNQILTRIDELKKELENELRKIEKIFLSSSSGLNNFIHLLMSKNMDHLATNNGIPDAYFIDIVKINDEVDQITSIVFNCKKILESSENYLNSNSKILHKLVKQISNSKLLSD